MKTNGRYTYLKPDGSGFSEVYSPDNKPMKNDIGLGNVANERQYSPSNKIPNQDSLMYVKFAKNSGGHLAYIGVNGNDNAYLTSSTLKVAEISVPYSVKGLAGTEYGPWVNLVSFDYCDIDADKLYRCIDYYVSDKNIAHSSVFDARIISGENNTKIVQVRGGAITAANITYSGVYHVSIKVKELTQWSLV